MIPTLTFLFRMGHFSCLRSDVYCLDEGLDLLDSISKIFINHILFSFISWRLAEAASCVTRYVPYVICFQYSYGLVIEIKTLVTFHFGWRQRRFMVLGIYCNILERPFDNRVLFDYLR